MLYIISYIFSIIAILCGIVSLVSVFRFVKAIYTESRDHKS